jgi:FtsP/CotA-like multicopper oxidase with cupredoxin domain
MDRRTFLIAGISIPAALILKGCGGGSPGQTQVATAPSFSMSLPLPIELTAEDVVLTDDIKKVFNLEINQGKHEFFPGASADTYYISLAGEPREMEYLGPTLRVKRGEEITINYKNNLPEATTIHGHGMHVHQSMDGTPHQVINPGETWSINYTVDQVASTNWYHPHIMDKSAEHVYKGVSGLIIVDDEVSLNLDIPKTYGVDDIPLIIQDKRFDYSGKFVYSPSMMDKMKGFMGDYFLVNGEISPYISVEAKQIRFRILNASNARVFDFSLEGEEFTQIAGDGSFLEQGVKMTSLKLSPAERAEIIIDFTERQDEQFVFYDKTTGKLLMRVNVDKEKLTNDTMLPERLTTLEPIILTGNEPTHQLTLTSGMDMDGMMDMEGMDMSDMMERRKNMMDSMGGMGGMGAGMSMMKIKIDGNEAKAMDMNRIDLTIPKDEVQIWEIINDMPMTHNFHLHGTHFRILERKLGDEVIPVPDNEKGYKDVVRIDGKGMPPIGAPANSVKIVVKMTDFTDPTTPYMFHCHILEHEDSGMMGQFLVV